MVWNDPVAAVIAGWRDHGWGATEHFAASVAVTLVDRYVELVNGRIFLPHHLTRSRHEALSLLFFSRHSELPMGKLGQRLMVHPTSVTTTVDTLETLGFAKRVAHPTDRRTTLATVTDDGRAAIRETNTALIAAQFGLGALSQAEATRLFNILKPVREVSGDLNGRDGRPRPDPILTATRNWQLHGWDVGAHFTAALSLYRTQVLILHSHSDALRRHQLTNSRYEALTMICLSDGGELSMGRLSHLLGVHPTSMTTTVDGLEQQGLVQRVRDISDGRSMLAKTTPKGRRLISATNAALAVDRFGLGALAPAQAQSIFDILCKVRRASAVGTADAQLGRVR